MQMEAVLNRRLSGAPLDDRGAASAFAVLTGSESQHPGRLHAGPPDPKNSPLAAAGGRPRVVELRSPLRLLELRKLKLRG